MQRALLESLKNGSNIRNLGPNETITVCVFGGTSNRELGVKTVRLPDAGMEKGGQASEPQMDKDADVIAVNGSVDALRGGGQPTVMTIRVKKADADAFAKGDLDPDAFTKRAQITKYAAQGGGWGRLTLF